MKEIQAHSENELDKMPFYKENQQMKTIVGTGFYYIDLLEYYHKENPETTRISEDVSFNEGETTVILETGKYSYEYDHAVNIVDKINTHEKYIEKTFEADRSSEARQAVEKDIGTELKNEQNRIKERQRRTEYMKNFSSER